MPAYVSHCLMAQDVYDKIDNKYVDIDYMLTFSLGGDLARFSKCRRTCHKEKMDEFIDNMWNYIKDKDLVNNKEYIGVLYGHICHYYMDKVCHPLIRKIDKLSINVGFKSHTLIESYIDSYLVNYKLDNNIDKYDMRYLFKGKVRRIYKMIDDVYYKTYGVKYVSFSYNVTKFLYSKVGLLIRIFRKKILRNIFKYDEYLDKNKEIDIVNSDNKIYYKDYLGNDCNDSFIELYNKSIELSLNRINNLE
jgi:hypothetical protein